MDKQSSNSDWPLGPFDGNVPAHLLKQEWVEYKRGFELVAEMKGITDQHEKCVALLARGGRFLRQVYDVDKETESAVEGVECPRARPEYDNAIKKFDKYFMGGQNPKVEKGLFEEIKQEVDEPFRRFLLRLQTQAGYCGFESKRDEMVVAQVCKGARLEKVRDKAFSDDMTLPKISAYAEMQELLLREKEKDKKSQNVVAQIQKFGGGTRPKWQYEQGRFKKSECARCGSTNGHSEAACPARRELCRKCGQEGHFARKCRSGKRAARGGFRGPKRGSAGVVRNVTVEDDWDLNEGEGSQKV